MATFILPVGVWHVSPNGTWQGHRNRNPPSVNPGADYECPINTPVRAAHDGVVRYAQSTYAGSGGRLVYVRRMTGGVNYIETQYLHLERVLVEGGEPVKQGDIIGYSGASGFGRSRWYGPHLHVSLYINGANVDFQKHVDAGVSVPSGTTYTPLLDPVEVRRLQEALNVYDYNLKVDGVFGVGTHDALVLYQREYDLVPDGIAGPATWKSLEENMKISDADKDDIAARAAVRVITGGFNNKDGTNKELWMVLNDIQAEAAGTKKLTGDVQTAVLNGHGADKVAQAVWDHPITRGDYEMIDGKKVYRVSRARDLLGTWQLWVNELGASIGIVVGLVKVLLPVKK